MLIEPAQLVLRQAARVELQNEAHVADGPISCTTVACVLPVPHATASPPPSSRLDASSIVVPPPARPAQVQWDLIRKPIALVIGDANIKDLKAHCDIVDRPGSKYLCMQRKDRPHRRDDDIQEYLGVVERDEPHHFWIGGSKVRYAFRGAHHFGRVVDVTFHKKNARYVVKLISPEHELLGVDLRHIDSADSAEGFMCVANLDAEVKNVLSQSRSLSPQLYVLVCLQWAMFINTSAGLATRQASSASHLLLCAAL
jgi:hypothetical protein